MTMMTSFYATVDVPVNVSDVAGGTLADANTFAAQHVVNVDEVVVRCHSQVLSWI